MITIRVYEVYVFGKKQICGNEQVYLSSTSSHRAAETLCM